MPPSTRRTLFQTGFPEANQDPLSQGGIWTNSYTSNSNAAIVGNRVRAHALSADCTMSLNSVGTPGDQFVRVEIATFGAGVMEIHAECRLSAGPSWTGYLFVARKGAAPASEIIYMNAGVPSSKASENVTAWAGGDSVSSEAIGSSLKLYRNDGATELISASDSALASGRPGLDIYTETALANTELDNFSFGDFASAAVTGTGGSGMTETDVVAGGKTLVITLTGDTFLPS